jgi:hypothetical protein
MDPIHSDDAGPRDGHPDDAWINLAGADRRDRDTHDYGDDGQRKLPPATGLFGRLRVIGDLSLLPKLCDALVHKILYAFGKVRGYIFGVFGPEFHPRCEGCLRIAPQFFARFMRRATIVRLDWIRSRGIQRVWLSLRILRGIVMWRVVLRIVLWRVILRRVVLGWLRLRGRPFLRGLGHVHRIGDGC